MFLAEGPTRYLGGSIESFALPYGWFIFIAAVLFVIYRRPHAVPSLKYKRGGHQTSFGTAEPGPVPAPAATRAASAPAPAATDSPASADSPGPAAGDEPTSPDGPEPADGPEPGDGSAESRDTDGQGS
jgi:hypothetical protein